MATASKSWWDVLPPELQRRVINEAASPREYVLFDADGHAWTPTALEAFAEVENDSVEGENEFPVPPRAEVLDAARAAFDEAVDGLTTPELNVLADARQRIPFLSGGGGHVIPLRANHAEFAPWGGAFRIRYFHPDTCDGGFACPSNRGELDWRLEAILGCDDPGYDHDHLLYLCETVLECIAQERANELSHGDVFAVNYEARHTHGLYAGVVFNARTHGTLPLSCIAAIEGQEYLPNLFTFGAACTTDEADLVAMSGVLRYCTRFQLSPTNPLAIRLGIEQKGMFVGYDYTMECAIQRANGRAVMRSDDDGETWHRVDDD